MRYVRALVWAPALLSVYVLIGFSWELLVQAYGDGPPYFGRTENMDKWDDPWGPILFVALIAASVVTMSWTAWRALDRRARDRAEHLPPIARARRVRRPRAARRPG